MCLIQHRRCLSHVQLAAYCMSITPKQPFQSVKITHLAKGLVSPRSQVMSDTTPQTRFSPNQSLCQQRVHDELPCPNCTDPLHLYLNDTGVAMSNAPSWYIRPSKSAHVCPASTQFQGQSHSSAVSCLAALVLTVSRTVCQCLTVQV